MALPKEPRQKMINFMYLVLTAMLALNVSSEILNAFKVVDNSLLSSNVAIDKSTKSYLDILNAATNEEGKKEKAAIWKPRAEQAVALTSQMNDYIEQLKAELKKESDLKTVDGKETFREDDLDASTRLMDTKGKGKELLAKLTEFKSSLANVLGDKKNLVGELPIDLSIPKSSNEASNKDWTTAYFHMTPTVASLTMLSKFQNDVKRSGNIVADICAAQLGKVEIVYDQFDVLIGQNSQYLMPGQPFELTAGLGAYSSAAKPTVTVNGSSVALDASGKALYKETSGGPGTKNFNVTVSFKDPLTGEPKTKTTQVSYTVGQPSGAAIFLEKMNVVYIGVPNPISVSGGSAGGAEKTSVSFSGGGLSGTNGHYVINPPASAQGEQTLTVSVDGKGTPFKIRVKRLPDPTGFVGSYTGGAVPASAFRAMGGVVARLKDSDFEAPFQVQGYTVGGYVNGAYTEQAVSGSQWGGNPIIAQAKPGSLVSIFNLRAVGPDGAARKLPEMAFRLQ